MRRAEARREAARIATGLIETAIVMALQDPVLARKQAALARRIALKFNLRFDGRLKRSFCHGCKGLVLPGMNARVRLGPNKQLLVTCLDCGYVNRKTIRKNKKARLNTERQGLSNPLRA